jgi:RecB family exonuclease
MKIDRHSPSSLNLFAASPAMFVAERILGLKQPVGAIAHRGSAVEAGLTHGLLNPDSPLEDCVAIALTFYDTLTALSGDVRREELRKSIPAMVASALEELRPYGEPTRSQDFVEWRPDGLEYPIVGYLDYAWDQHGIVVDLKTTSALPSKIKGGHARQVALYATSDNYSARIAYVTPKKRATYAVENVREHRKALHQIALSCERFLALSDDPEFFVSITAPDVESFYWAPPEARQMAFEVWRI